jgi:hypothetical protein
VGENIDTIVKNTEDILDAIVRRFDLEVNPEKTKYMSISRYNKGEKKRRIKIVNRYFEDVAKFTYLGRH